MLGVAAIWTIAVAQAGPVDALPSGITGRSGNPDAGGGATCSDCHTGDAATPTITVIAPTQVAGGSTVDIEIIVSGGPAVRAGFNASFTDLSGTLLPGAGSQVIGNEITHAGAKAMVQGATSWEFRWTAPPTAGPQTLYAAAVSANGADGNQGDGTATATFDIIVTAADVLGDVNCTGETNIVDALVIAQFTVQTRVDLAACGAGPVGSNEIVADRGDVNASGQTDIVDALVIARCTIGLPNVFCPDV